MTHETMRPDVIDPSRSAPRPADGSSSRTLDVVAHLSPLVVGVVAAVAVGQPLGWLALLFPLGPLLSLAIGRVVVGRSPRAWRSLLAFSIVSGVVIGGGWLVTQAGQLWPPLSLLFPLGLLAFVAGLVNFLLIVLGRIQRAVRGWPFDYPWIPDALARLVGLTDGWEE